MQRSLQCTTTPQHKNTHVFLSLIQIYIKKINKIYHKFYIYIDYIYKKREKEIVFIFITNNPSPHKLETKIEN